MYSINEQKNKEVKCLDERQNGVHCASESEVRDTDESGRMS